MLLSLKGIDVASMVGIVGVKLLEESECAFALNGGRKPAAKSAASAGRPLARELMI